MPYSFRIDPAHRVVLFRATGVFTADELLRCLDEVVADPSFDRSFDHLVDLRDVTVFPVTAADVRRRIEQDQGMEKELDAPRMALVSARDDVYGMTRIYEARMVQAPPIARAFRSMQEATEWLGIPAELADWGARGDSAEQA